MDKSHPRFTERLEPIQGTELSYKKTGIPTLEGEFLRTSIQTHHYTTTIEIGCALGISSLYMCDALSGVAEASHTIIDPYQMTQWQGIGIKNLGNCGFDFFTLIEKPSELALPELLQQERTFDFAFIDGWHTFDHTLLDFFYLNRLIRVGGMIVFDDVRYPAVSKVLRYVAHYPHYTLISDQAALRPEGKKLRLLKWGLLLGKQVCKLFPASLRPLIFSPTLRSGHSVHQLVLRQPRWLALYKTGDDTRPFDWFQDF